MYTASDLKKGLKIMFEDQPWIITDFDFSKPGKGQAIYNCKLRVTVRPKLYIACGISGQIQHTAGMDGSAMIVSINTDPAAPINKIADYAITGSVEEVIPKMIKYYKQNSK